MKIRLERPSNAPNFCFEVIDVETGESVEFIQSDWDYAPTATTFGWQPCECGGTDGTVDCVACDRKVGDMLAEAYDYLCDHEGEEVENLD